MINICTLCDKNYLAKGLAMRQSLIDLGVKYRIYWLCLDEETFVALNEKVRDDNIALFRLSEFEENDEELRKAKSNPKSDYGSQRDNYIWSLTPYFTNYILNKYIERGEYIIYVDSDLEFYSHPQKILDVVRTSIGLHTHRFTPTRKKLNTGIYNVGIVIFKKDAIGEYVSGQWKRWVMHVDNEYYKEYGTCGDQKYLEAFFLITDCKNISIFDEDEIIFHGAPWCCNDLLGRQMDFYHFSHFKIIDENQWSDSYNGEWNPIRYPNVKILYENYFNRLTKIANEFNLWHL